MRSSTEKKALPCSDIASRHTIGVLQHDKKHAKEMKKIIIAMISFGIFVAAIFLHIPTTNMYRQHYGVFSALVTSRGDAITDESPVKYYNIDTIPDIFDWLNDTFIPQAFVTTDYNGAALPENQWGRIATFNKVLGAVHFEVTYMESGDCDTPEFIGGIYSSCYDSSRTVKDELLISFGTNVSAATTLLTDKKDNGRWLNSSTQQLVISVITLNAQLPGYAVTKLQLDFNDGGYVEPSASTTSTLLNQYPSATTIVLDVAVLAWFLPWILFPAIWLRRIISSGTPHFREFFVVYGENHWFYRLRRWLLAKWVEVVAHSDGWLVINLFKGPSVCLFYITVLATQAVTMNSDFRRKLISLGEGGQTDGQANDTLKSVTHSFRVIAILTVLLRLLATAAVFVLGLRILSTFRRHDGLSILTRTIARGVRTLWTFLPVFGVVFLAFAASGTVLFGDRVQDFSSLLSAMKSCMNIGYGGFDFDSIKDIDYSVVYYWAYITMQVFVLLNMVLAIVIDAYQDEKKRLDKDLCRWVFLRVGNSVFRQWFARVYDLLLWLPCCRHKHCRHCVVFWGRIRSVVLYEKLSDMLDVTRGVDPFVRRPSQPSITAIFLKELFPEAHKDECDATMMHLIAEKEHFLSHELLPKYAEEEKRLASRSISGRVNYPVLSPEMISLMDTLNLKLNISIER